MHDQIRKQGQSFDSLVSKGVYSQSFDHAPDHKAFVRDVLVLVTSRLPSKKPLTLLDCGCGTGSWLAFVHDVLAEQGITDVRCMGFDLSGNMVQVARERVRRIASSEDIKQGDVLDVASYQFAGLAGGVDLLFSYDVVQQLPRRQQYAACQRMAERLAPGGLALIFDNDSKSPFGRRMAKRKFVTRYFGLPLVPRYYCNAAYPPLQLFRNRLNDNDAYQAEIQVRSDEKKWALIVERNATNG